MYEQNLLTGAPNVFSFRISSTITDRENESINQFLEKEIERFGTIKLIIIMDYDQSTDNAKFLFEDLRFARLHSKQIDGIAIIGNKAAEQDTWVGLFGLFGGIETAYFDHSEKENAMKWIRDEWPAIS